MISLKKLSNSLRKFLGAIRSIKWNKKSVAIGFFVLFLLANIFVTFSLSVFYFLGIDRWKVIAKIPATPRQFVDKVVDEIIDLPYFAYKFKSHELDVFKLSVKEKYLQQLNENLPDLVNEIYLKDEYKVYHPAVLNIEGKEYKVDIRYRGDTKSHWLWKKKSIRVRFRGEDTYKGMDRINFIVPEDRGYISENFNLHIARKLGLAVPESDMVVLELNGTPSVYFMIETYGKSFLEKQQLSGDTNFYSELYLEKPIFIPFIESAPQWKNYIAQEKGTPENYSDLMRMVNLISAPDDVFVDEIWNVFDKEQFLLWYLHTFLAQSIHQGATHNIRLYFDPTKGKFLFVPHDVLRWPVDDNSLFKVVNPIITRLLLADPNFTEEFQKLVWDYVSDKENLKDDLKFFDKEWERTHVAIFQDPISRDSNRLIENRMVAMRALIESNYKEIKNKLSQALVSSIVNVNPVALQNFSQGRVVNAEIELRLEGYSKHLLQSVEVSGEFGKSIDGHELFVDENNNAVYDDGDRLLGIFVYDESKNVTQVQLRDFSLASKLEKRDEDIDIFYPIGGVFFELEPAHERFFIVGKNKEKIVLDGESEVKFDILNSITEKSVKGKDVVLRYSDESMFVGADRLNVSVDEFVKSNPVFVKTTKDKLFLSPGTYEFNELIILPKNVELTIGSGTTIRFGKYASLFARGPIKAVGTQNNPISFVSAIDGEIWGVVAVLQSQSESLFKHTRFVGGGDAHIAGAYFSGMLAVHHSDVQIENSFFENANGDDGVNVKYGKAIIENNTFLNNGFDGLDLDFTSGVVRNNTFQDNGNDGLDVSGVKDLVVSGNLVTGSGDKGISIGESSLGVILKNNTLTHNIGFGIAVKDLSSVKVLDSVIEDNAVGIGAYQKKSIFGGATVEVINTKFERNDKKVEVDAKSSVKISE